MSILFLLVPLTLALVTFAGWAFLWAVDSGQFDELDAPGWEVLWDEEPTAVNIAAEHADG